MKNVRLRFPGRCIACSVLLTALIGCSSSGPIATTPTGVAALSGSYVFSVSGSDSNDGDYFVVGSFMADGKGNITAAVADYNLGSGIDEAVPLAGTYQVAGTTATINLTDGKSVQDTFTASTLTSGSTAIQTFDGSGSGTLYAQTTSNFTPAGTYAYSVKGEGEGTVTGSGQFVAGSGGTFTSGTLTYTDAGTTMNYSSLTGFLDPPQSSGRGQAALAGNNMAYYVISPTQVLLIGLDQRALLLAPAQKM